MSRTATQYDPAVVVDLCIRLWRIEVETSVKCLDRGPHPAELDVDPSLEQVACRDLRIERDRARDGFEGEFQLTGLKLLRGKIVLGCRTQPRHVPLRLFPEFRRVLAVSRTAGQLRQATESGQYQHQANHAHD